MLEIFLARLQPGYVATDENEEHTVARALEVVRELRQDSNPVQDNSEERS